ncbi:FAD-dependent oxidoreductase [Bartonella sp. LJL80]
MAKHEKIVIVGAGPAGIRAAHALVEAGISPVVIDEARQCGGQIYRQSFVGDGRPKVALYGDQSHKAARLHRLFTRLSPAIDYHPQTTVWHLQEKTLHLSGNGTHDDMPFDRLILATGATDRVLPFQGWTLPGVYTLGAAQTALKAQATLVSDDIVFMGASPLLYLVAYQYMKAGARVRAILDTAPMATKRHLIAAAMHDFLTIWRGLAYAVKLKAAGVDIISGVQQVTAQGGACIEAVTFKKGGSIHTIATKALAYNFGLRSETQLADLAGVTFAFNPQDRAWAPKSGVDTRTSRNDVYLAGDGASIEGADAAELSGEIAALSVLADMGRSYDSKRHHVLINKRQKLRHARKPFDKAFPFPLHWMAQVPDDLVLCRCEEITIANIRNRQQFYQQWEMNRSKAVSRVGMGRCQGRMCGAALAELLRLDHACAVEDIGRLRAQPPIKPLSIKEG